MDAQQLVKALSDYVNRMGHDKDGVAEQVMREHRTLQQSLFGLFLRVIEEWSKQGHCDLRNEYAVESSKKIMELLDGNSATPFI
jgi:hypothetical protein